MLMDAPGLQLEGLEIPSGPIRNATIRLVQHLEEQGRLTIDHESLVQVLLRSADAMDRAGAKAVYALPALSKEYREIRAELLDVTQAGEGEIEEFDVVLLQPVLADAG